MDPKNEGVQAVPALKANSTYSANDQPVPVLHVYSVRGVEYLMMTLTLWFGAGALLGILLGFVNGQHDFKTLAFPVAMLVVAVVVFGFFFTRLKKAELANPSLRFDPSKRRLSQITQTITFVTSFFAIVGLLYAIFGAISGVETSVGKAVGSALVTLVVAGGVLAYYWFDEHKVR